jgi:hypothetical protein
MGRGSKHQLPDFSGFAGFKACPIGDFESDVHVGSDSHQVLTANPSIQQVFGVLTTLALPLIDRIDFDAAVHTPASSLTLAALSHYVGAAHGMASIHICSRLQQFTFIAHKSSI